MRLEEHKVKSRRVLEPTLFLCVGTSLFRIMKLEFVLTNPERFHCIEKIVPSGELKLINSIQSLDDVIHWSPSTIRELGHLVAPTGGEQVADACRKRKNCLPGKPY
ncbi:hypothetical protein TNCV_2948161 [Trichonephila clavipes]|nr:hypothetical protein TNCV_2948161 [Trichonephila clavipes]